MARSSAPSPLVSAIDGPETFAAAFEVSRETLEKLGTYERLLKRWQNTINLVAPSTINHVWGRHFADSAQLWQLSPPGARRWVDIGSGAGFPGLVLAILGSEAGQTHHTLIESDNRKAAFLREAARETGVAVDILCARIENPGTRAKVGAADCVTARALAPLPRLLELAYPFFGEGTAGLFPKGRDAASELNEAARAWKFEAQSRPSVTDADGRILVIKSLMRAASS